MKTIVINMQRVTISLPFLGRPRVSALLCSHYTLSQLVHIKMTLSRKCNLTSYKSFLTVYSLTNVSELAKLHTPVC